MEKWNWSLKWLSLHSVLCSHCQFKSLTLWSSQEQCHLKAFFLCVSRAGMHDLSVYCHDLQEAQDRTVFAKQISSPCECPDMEPSECLAHCWQAVWFLPTLHSPGWQQALSWLLPDKWKGREGQDEGRKCHCSATPKASPHSTAAEQTPGRSQADGSLSSELR